MGAAKCTAGAWHAILADPKVQLAVRCNGRGRATQMLKGCGNHQEWERKGEPRAFTVNSAIAAKNDALLGENNEVDHGNNI